MHGTTMPRLHSYRIRADSQPRQGATLGRRAKSTLIGRTALLAGLGGEGQILSFAGHIGSCARKDPFRRPFDNQASLVRFVDNDRKPAPLEVERNLIDLGISTSPVG